MLSRPLVSIAEGEDYVLFRLRLVAPFLLLPLCKERTRTSESLRLIIIVVIRWNVHFYAILSLCRLHKSSRQLLRWSEARWNRLPRAQLHIVVGTMHVVLEVYVIIIYVYREVIQEGLQNSAGLLECILCYTVGMNRLGLRASHKGVCAKVSESSLPTSLSGVVAW